MRPNSSRTGTTQWRRVRQQRLDHDFNNGLTRCPECNIWLDWEYTRRPNSAEPDHIVPHSQGGPDTLENTRTICRNCNQRSGGKLGAKRGVQATRKVKYQTALEW